MTRRDIRLLNPTELRVGIRLIEQLRNEGRTIIVVEHVMDAIRGFATVVS